MSDIKYLRSMKSYKFHSMNQILIYGILGTTKFDIAW